MKNYADKEYLHTRIYAMRGRLLRLRDYNALLREQEGLVEKTAEAHRMTISGKEALFREQIRDVLNLAEATAYHAPLFMAFLRRYEARNLKLLLAKAFDRSVAEQWYDIGRFAILDRGLLDEKLTPKTIERMLTDTWLDGLFRGSVNYDHLLIRLDRLTLARMLDCAAFLDRDDAAFLREIIFMRAAVSMTAWKWRLTINYGWEYGRATAYGNIANDLMEDGPARFIVTVERQLDRDLEELKKQTGSEPGAQDIEHHLEQYYYRWIRHVFYRDFHSICCVAAYLWLLGRQIQNMFVIFEGLRFRLPHEDILERIISET
ncbi:MAG: V-type ATPase subunit [Syntrophales bacterium]|jgi:vacuolar-type H+-ATPase subunit C/Vma6|nr:V-type ATPase subunit [Syntrophales bacterium]MCK9528153.1 V-type ATPase subunit [Syntrophales bacterium]MDX9921123.1 V-type ATPase subunit [Syntrophales bacterium]